MVGMVETWMEEKYWEVWKDKMPNEFVWEIQHAERKEKKGKSERRNNYRSKKEWEIEEEGKVEEIKEMMNTRIKTENGEKFNEKVLVQNEKYIRDPELRDWRTVKEMQTLKTLRARGPFKRERRENRFRIMVEVFEDRNRDRLLDVLGRSRDVVNRDVENIRVWLTKQPHLPDTLEDHVIERFLVMSKFYLEIAKSKIDMYFTVRSLIPEFYNLHPCGEAIKAVYSVAYIVPLPNLTPSLSRIVCCKLKDPNPEKFDAISCISYLLNIAEIRLREETSASDTYVCDLEGGTLTHVAKFTPMLLKKLNFLLEKVFAMRSKAIYLCNAPAFIDSFLTILTRHFKPKLMERVIVCKDLDQLHRAVPKSALPKEFNGSLKSLQVYQDLWMRKFEHEKLVFDRLRTLRVNENLRPQKLLEDDIFGVQGNFRQLSMD
ncbi:hypothetical protein FQR65_LT13493 [Abscondita terminalis]|nr:hypothetical protein FQR65_LT13493 [Abscondita terminalis]